MEIILLNVKNQYALKYPIFYEKMEKNNTIFIFDGNYVFGG